MILAARAAELPGGIHVLRALPQAQRRMVGPFVFLDQMGPTVLSPGQYGDVLSHPHIGLSTVTYLYDGELIHKDSLGTVQRIAPGEVNWMTAGRGIVHAELGNRDGGERPRRAYGIQIWVALPRDYEETAPTFEHYEGAQLPQLDDGGASIRLLAGEAFGARSAVKTHSTLFYADVTLEAGATVAMPKQYDERAAYVIEGEVELAGGVVKAGELAIIERGDEVLFRSVDGAKLLLFGGEPLEGPRHIHWNFVSSSKDRIEQARQDWQGLKFPRVPGETQYIPLPGGVPPPVSYP